MFEPQQTPPPTNTVCMYNACMTHIQVRDVPEEVHQALIRQADLAGQSLQQYLATKLAQIAATPTLEEVLDRIEQQNLGRLTRSDVLAAIESERARS